MDNDNPSQPNQNGKHKQTNNQFSRESGERELVHSLREEALRGAVTMKTSMCFPKKKKVKVSMIQLYHPWAYVQRILNFSVEILSHIFIPVLFTIAKIKITSFDACNR